MTADDFTDESGRQADAANIVGFIERVQARADVEEPPEDPRSFDWNVPSHRQWVRRKFRENGELNEAILPGFGEDGLGGNARDNCGQEHPFGCPECGNVVKFGRTCAQSVCSRCGVAWVRDTGINNAAKMRRVRKEIDWNTPDDEWQKLHHQVISPPLSWYYVLACGGYTMEEAQEKTLEVVKQILDEQRAQGRVIRHSYRGKNDDGSIAREGKSDDLGEWKERINSGRAWFDDVRDELAWKPHYHCVVVADHLKVIGTDHQDDEPALSEYVEERTGWVLHRIVDDEGKSLRTDGAMARALTYCLSHADIMVRDDAHNSSIARWVGTFDDDIIKSSPRFSAKPTDLEWADAAVRDAASTVLGLQSGTSQCGRDLPGVDEPDELARRIMEDIWPDHDRPEWRDEHADAILHHVSEGNIDVDVSTMSGSGGDVTLRDSSGIEWNDGSLGDMRGGGLTYGGDSGDSLQLTSGDDYTHEVLVDDQDETDDVDDDQDGDGCGATMVPLEVIRARGLLDDAEWCKQAPHVDELRRADREWPDEIEPWETDQPGTVVGAG